MEQYVVEIDDCCEVRSDLFITSQGLVATVDAQVTKLQQ